MSDINQVITLGIGTPASVPRFLTMGLAIGSPVTVTPLGAATWEVVYQSRAYGVPFSSRTWVVNFEDADQ